MTRSKTRTGYPWELTDPQTTLTEILDSTQAQVGDVIVACVDLETQAVTGTRRLRLPAPAPRTHSIDVDAAVDRLSHTLCALAQDLAGEPEHGQGRSVRTLVTLICREGRVVATASDYDWYYAWRYSNHFSAAYDGDIYIVTPHGWIALGERPCGLEPRLSP